MCALDILLQQLRLGNLLSGVIVLTYVVEMAAASD